MANAYVGFSSPIGYDYGHPARQCLNDLSSSPNPVLMGAVGLMCFYDEIWFACESLCPNNMRDLPFVFFLDKEKPAPDIEGDNFSDFCSPESSRELGLAAPSLNAMFPVGYNDGMGQYLGYFDGKVDNHTHAIEFFCRNFGGNPRPEQVMADIWVLQRYKELNATLVTNPVTENILARPAQKTDVKLDDGMCRFVDTVVTIDRMFDISSEFGPFHPCLLDLRNEPSIENFRKWVSGTISQFSNLPAEQVAEQVRFSVLEFQERELAKSVSKSSLSSLCLDFVKDFTLSALPGVSQASKIRDALVRNDEIDAIQWKAFLAKSHMVLERSELKARHPSNL